MTLAPDLDIPGRAAAAARVQALVLAYRPALVRLHIPPGPPNTAALSVLARLRRLCESLGIPLTLTGPPATPVHGHGGADGQSAAVSPALGGHRGASS